MINFIRSRKILALSIVLVIAGGIFAFSGGDEGNRYDFVEVEQTNLVQLVSVTGNIRPAEAVDLAFDRSGIVSNIYLNIGDAVQAGETIARLETSSLTSELNEAQASLEGEVAKLAELNRGPTSYEISVKESDVAEARQQLENAYESIDTIVQESYNDAYDALKNKTAALFDGSQETFRYEFTFNVCDFQDQSIAEDMRLDIEFLLDDWRDTKSIADNTTKQELLNHLENTRENLQEFDDFFSAVNDALESACESDESIASEYRTSVSTAKSNILAALSDVKDLKQDISVKAVTLERKERELEQLIAGASDEEIQAQQAAVNQASATVDNIRSQIEKGIIRAPFSGIITKIDIERGETVASSNAVISVITGSDFEIKTNIPEVDISKVKIGDTASITLDAFESDQILRASVTKINPSETLVDGVTTYETTLKFDEQYEGIKSGMTADIDIKTGQRDSVLAVPKRAVVESDGRTYVRVLTDENTIREVDVQTGLLGSSGNIEITQGLEGGENVVTFVRD